MLNHEHFKWINKGEVIAEKDRMLICQEVCLLPCIIITERH